MKSLATLAATAAVTLALVVPSGGAAAGAAGPSVQRAQATYAASTHRLVNDRRTDARVPRLRQDACLRRAAQQQARRMADGRRLFHQDLGAVMRRCGLRSAGENVAGGYPTPAAAVRGWMGSPGHRANILSRGYRVAGVGAVRRGSTWYVAQVFGRKA